MQALPSKAEGNGGWLQISVRALGLYAQTSTPAYCLAALFALSSPFGFASPAQAAAEAAVKAQRQQQLAQVSAAASAQGSNGLVARLIANAQTQKAAKAQAQAPLRTVPPFWQLAFFAAAFGTGGYIIDQGDALNGSGVVSAWSLTYLLFKTLPSIRQLPRNPLALSLSAAVLTLGIGIHGSHYFDKTSWQGAKPSLTGAGNDARASTEGRSKLITFDTVGRTEQDNGPRSIFAGRKSSSTATPSAALDQNASTEGSRVESIRNNDGARTAAYLHRQGGAQQVVP
ncbi:Altered inheritance of mitochondria protein 19 [Kalmanozyma brasiliensis GHG001]|uniref:Altered inheritance of mitochondria protein 19 n=1 Tax=Kalmanozyma brasiliensis (strain GHG001) TaxID=1365824 RepID=UPI0028680213|nr:Altered inheritance of mitochondria protein 19 [Kalmanozyma brasiliensis GHG001]KAF6767533.1 Altered inheritance of mitochondria protein 19 [Kalmanozyma brasiliensis GHG001]